MGAAVNQRGVISELAVLSQGAALNRGAVLSEGAVINQRASQCKQNRKRIPNLCIVFNSTSINATPV